MSVGVSFSNDNPLTSFRKPVLCIIPQNSKMGGIGYPQGPYLIPLVQTYSCQSSSAVNSLRLVALGE